MERVVMEMQNQRESGARPELVLRGAGDSEVEVLLGHREMLAGLVRLDLSHCEVGLDALGRLFGVLEPGVLEELTLEGVAVGGDGARAKPGARAPRGARPVGKSAGSANAGGDRGGAASLRVALASHARDVAR